MGKKKISSMKLIDNPTNRNVTYCKRKKGLLKKAMEISILCNQQVFLVIYDHSKQKLVTYQSNTDFNLTILQKLHDSPLIQNPHFETYDDNQYDEIVDQKVKTSWFTDAKGKNDPNDNMDLDKLSEDAENSLTQFKNHQSQTLVENSPIQSQQKNNVKKQKLSHRSGDTLSNFKEILPLISSKSPKSQLQGRKHEMAAQMAKNYNLNDQDKIPNRQQYINQIYQKNDNQDPRKLQSGSNSQTRFIKTQQAHDIKTDQYFKEQNVLINGSENVKKQSDLQLNYNGNLQQNQSNSGIKDVQSPENGGNTLFKILTSEFQQQLAKLEVINQFQKKNCIKINEQIQKFRQIGDRAVGQIQIAQNTSTDNLNLNTAQQDDILTPLALNQLQDLIGSQNQLPQSETQQDQRKPGFDSKSAENYVTAMPDMRAIENQSQSHSQKQFKIDTQNAQKGQILQNSFHLQTNNQIPKPFQQNFSTFHQGGHLLESDTEIFQPRTDIFENLKFNQPESLSERSPDEYME